EHVLEMDRREGRLARAEDQLALLLERDRRRAVDQVLHRARRDRAEGAHRARADDVAVDLRRAGGVRRAPVVRRVDGGLRPFREARDDLVGREAGVAVELRREHFDRRGGQRDADLAVGGGQRFEQAPRIRRARCTGDAEKDSHPDTNTTREAAKEMPAVAAEPGFAGWEAQSHAGRRYGKGGMGIGKGTAGSLPEVTCRPWMPLRSGPADSGVLDQGPQTTASASRG